MAATNFEALRSKRIDSLNVEVQEYRHRPTGALHYHLAADDRNNCFVAFVPCMLAALIVAVIGMKFSSKE